MKQNNLKNITSATDSFDGYKEICKNAVINKEIFNNFRSMPEYIYVVDNLCKSFGISFISQIEKYLDGIEFKDFTNKFKFNDIIGNTKRYNYEQYGDWSPVTLRYIKTICMLSNKFGTLDNNTIAEIGGGYGGQASIIMTEYKVKNYKIFDLNEVVGLIDKYLTIHNFTNYNTVNQIQLSEMNSIEIDLVISDYAFSELSGITQDIYFDKVISKSKKGYMTLNFTNLLQNRLKSWPLQKYQDKLKSINMNVNMYPDIPSTGTKGACGKNCIIIWNKIT